MKNLSHTNEKGKADMVDVGYKPNQMRTAKAIGSIKLKPETVQLLRDNQIIKGDVITVAEIAGIQAGKKTSELIPLCHPLLITKLDVKARIMESGVECESFAKCTGQTGIEMEALMAVSIALLTIYDMCKAVDKDMEIENIHLIEKTKQ